VVIEREGVADRPGLALLAEMYRVDVGDDFISRVTLLWPPE
jgi:hypothetical protein